MILQNYPNNYPSYAQESIRVVSQKYHIPFLDNATIFKKISNYRNYFGSDGHPNENGYFIMARNVFDEIKKIDDKTAR